MMFKPRFKGVLLGMLDVKSPLPPFAKGGIEENWYCQETDKRRMD
jgi:hypothetical protein